MITMILLIILIFFLNNYLTLRYFCNFIIEDY